MKKYILVFLCLLFLSLGVLAEETQVVLDFPNDNKTEWIKRGCLKTEDFKDNKIILEKNTNFPFDKGNCESYAYIMCYRGDKNIAKEILNKMVDNSQAISRHIKEENNLLEVSAQYPNAAIVRTVRACK